MERDPDEVWTRLHPIDEATYRQLCDDRRDLEDYSTTREKILAAI